MYPALRFFRHQGGELALFNGATSTLANELMVGPALRRDGRRAIQGAAASQLPASGGGQCRVIVDTGLPLSPELSRTAHAGCLSFEMSSGRHRFIINSGSPKFAGERFRQMARLTAAHSTVTINDTLVLPPVAIGVSRSRSFTGGDLQGRSCAGRGTTAADAVIASHDGYRQSFRPAPRARTQHEWSGQCGRAVATGCCGRTERTGGNQAAPCRRPLPYPPGDQHAPAERPHEVVSADGAGRRNLALHLPRQRGRWSRRISSSPTPPACASRRRSTVTSLLPRSRKSSGFCRAQELTSG